VVVPPFSDVVRSFFLSFPTKYVGPPGLKPPNFGRGPKTCTTIKHPDDDGRLPLSLSRPAPFVSFLGVCPLALGTRRGQTRRHEEEGKRYLFFFFFFFFFRKRPSLPANEPFPPRPGLGRAGAVFGHDPHAKGVAVYPDDDATNPTQQDPAATTTLPPPPQVGGPARTPSFCGRSRTHHPPGGKKKKPRSRPSSMPLYIYLPPNISPSNNVIRLPTTNPKRIFPTHLEDHGQKQVFPWHNLFQKI